MNRKYAPTYAPTAAMPYTFTDFTTGEEFELDLRDIACSYLDQRAPGHSVHMVLQMKDDSLRYVFPDREVTEDEASLLEDMARAIVQRDRNLAAIRTFLS